MADISRIDASAIVIAEKHGDMGEKEKNDNERLLAIHKAWTDSPCIRLDDPDESIDRPRLGGFIGQLSQEHHGYLLEVLRRIKASANPFILLTSPLKQRKVI